MRSFRSVLARFLSLALFLTIFQTSPSISGGFAVTKEEELISTRMHFYGITAEHEAASYFNHLGIDDDDDEPYFGSFEMDYTRKSPALAFALGFFPGFVIHGLGHFYIGDKKSGNGLLFTETVSIALMFPVAQMANSLTNERDPSAMSKMCKGFGAALFVFSWMSDFANAPLKAATLNKRYGYSLHLCPKITHNIASLNLALSIE
jgi:hypothetical protein